MTAPRRFPPPDAFFIVRDASWQALAYVYCEDEPATAPRQNC
jgi:hypothetical protein